MGIYKNKLLQMTKHNYGHDFYDTWLKVNKEKNMT